MPRSDSARKASGAPRGLQRLPLRAQAAKRLQAVVERGRSLDRVLHHTRLPRAQRPLLQELVIGSVRHYYSLSDIVAQSLERPLRRRDAILELLLVIGIYQLRHTRIPPHAAVAETVAAAGPLGRPWAAGLVNGILRRLAADRPPQPRTLEAELDHPAWLIDALRSQYPERWPELLRENNRRAPMALRVNRCRVKRECYRERLAQDGIEAQPGACDETLILTAPVPAQRLPGFERGDVSIQDASAQLAAGLLEVRPGERVLDACAAPGGKAFHILERTPGALLTAIEIDDERCRIIERERERLGAAPLTLIRGDATRRDWWDGVPFERILLDAPCSGTGTLRRHPDIKLLKTEADAAASARLQQRLLESVWGCLAPGGRLLYCTCSMLAEENDAVIRSFLAAEETASVIGLRVSWGQPTEHGRQLLPQPQGGDGFYYALLERRKA